MVHKIEDFTSDLAFAPLIAIRMQFEVHHVSHLKLSFTSPLLSFPIS